ncbi:MAG: sulfite exporter TauE/SafE family protein [Proteobacteria bacterium]|nr:sulfite exporter TauE/SafE family protein [Pseudomonadota bacterium]
MILSTFLGKQRCVCMLHVIAFLWLGSWASMAVLASDQEQAGPSLHEPSHPTEVIKWAIRPAALYQNRVMVLLVDLKTYGGFSLYHDQVIFTPPAGTTLQDTKLPKTKELLDPVSGQYVPVVDGGTFELTFTPTETAWQKLKKSATDPQTSQDHMIGITYLGCSQELCLLPHTEYFSIKPYFVPEDYHLTTTTPNNVSNQADPATMLPEDQVREQSPLSWDHFLANQIQSYSSSFLWLILLSFLGGVLTNLTPCVYPMIPITLRALSTATQSPLKGSFYFSLGILTMYTTLGVVAALSGSLLGSFGASKSLNFILACFLLWMALSMLGYGNFNFLQRLGSGLGRSDHATKKVFFMGLGAGFVAAPCTGPVLAGLLSYAFSHLSLYSAILIFSVYSLGFATPYLFLGPILNKFSTTIRMPSTILTLVKIIMAAVIMALAFYYLRIPFYQLTTQITLDQFRVLAIAFGIIGILMITVTLWQKTLRSRTVFHIGPTITLAIALFAGSQILGLSTKSHLAWQLNPDHTEVMKQADSSPILVAMWAEWCTACKVMESTTFSDPKVTSRLSELGLTLVKFDVTVVDDHSEEILAAFGVKGLPAYIMLKSKTSGSHATDVTTKNLHGLYKPQHFLRELNSFYRE